MGTDTAEAPHRVATVVGRCARCVRRQPGRTPNMLVLVDYLTSRTVVAVAMRRGGPDHPVTPAPDGKRIRFYPVRPGKGAELECPDCRARPRRSRSQILAAADEARAQRRDVFYIGD